MPEAALDPPRNDRPAQDDQRGDDQQDGGGINIEVVRSFMASARRAIKQRKFLSAGILLLGVTLTVLIAKYAPRTSCTTSRTAVANSILDTLTAGRYC